MLCIRVWLFFKPKCLATLVFITMSIPRTDLIFDISVEHCVRIIKLASQTQMKVTFVNRKLSISELHKKCHGY